METLWTRIASRKLKKDAADALKKNQLLFSLAIIALIS
jgi:hypothetical protein